MNGEMRFLIVGSGSIGLRHQRILKSYFPNTQAKIFSRSGLATLSKRNEEILTDLEEAKKFRPNIVVLANPSSMHLEAAEDWIGDCEGLFIEKPLSDSLWKCRDFLEKTQKSGIPIQVGYNLRFLPSLVQFKEFINSDMVGKIYSVRAEVGQYLPKWRPDSDYSQSVTAQKKLGGGALLELSHEIDYLRWIFGEFDWVFATMEKGSSLSIDVEDMVQFQFSITGTKGNSFVGSSQLDLVRQDTTRKCEVIGEEGTLRWDAILNCVEIYPKNGEGWNRLFQCQSDRDECYFQEWSYFHKCLREGIGKPSPGLDDGVRVLEVIEAIRESSVRGSRQKIQRCHL